MANVEEKKWGGPTGTVTIVSAMNSFRSQCKTKLPEKWPPVLMAVTPGSTSSVIPEGPSIKRNVCGVGGFWQSHFWSSADIYTGQLKALDQLAYVV